MGEASENKKHPPCTVRALTGPEVLRQIRDFPRYCPACAAKVRGASLVPYRGRSLCVPCFLKATSEAVERSRPRVPLYVRVRPFQARGGER